jgi:hypothetical protein
VVLSLASLVTALVVVAGTTAAVRTSSGAPTFAFLGGPTLIASPDTAAAPPPLPTTTVPPVALSGPLSNPKSLDAALAASGYPVPAGANVYAAKVTRTDAGLSYDDYQAGGGALGQAFWPASSIKVLAAVGALEFVGTMGFSGAATVSFAGDKTARTIQSIYNAALTVSSNADYDLLVEIAGVDWLNKQFLTPARGFPVTVIQRSYAGGDPYHTPAMTLVEGGRKVTVPARTSSVDTSCAQGNCSDLFEMSESVRRVVLNDEIPPADRFHVTPADVTGLSGALLAAQGWIAPAVTLVLGAGTRIYSKPGYVPNLDCMDVTFLDAKGQRLLLSATVPERSGGCAALVNLAAGVLRLLKQ